MIGCRDRRIGGELGGRRERGVAAIAIVVSAIVVACSSSSSSDGTPTVPTTLTPAASATPAFSGTPTPVDYGLAGQFAPALLQPADVSPDFHVAQNQNKVLSSRDVPGLTSDAKGAFVVLASPDKNEFVNQIAVVPDDHAVSRLLEAFDASNYLSGLTGGAKDATASPGSVAGAPAGAKALTFSGTEDTQAGTQHVDGEAVAFVHGPVFVIVIHGAFQAPKYPLSGPALAASIDARLSTIPGAN